MKTAWRDGRPPKGGVKYPKAPMDDVPAGRRQPAPKTGFCDDEVCGNQTAFTRGSRNRASAREMAGMSALARPLSLGLPPQNPDNLNTTDRSQDTPNIPANYPHEHK